MDQMSPSGVFGAGANKLCYCTEAMNTHIHIISLVLVHELFGNINMTGLIKHKIIPVCYQQAVLIIPTASSLVLFIYGVNAAGVLCEPQVDWPFLYDDVDVSQSDVLYLWLGG